MTLHVFNILNAHLLFPHIFVYFVCVSFFFNSLSKSASGRDSGATPGTKRRIDLFAFFKDRRLLGFFVKLKCAHTFLSLSPSLSVVSSEDKTASLKWLAQKRYRSIQQISISLFSCVWSDGGFHSDSFHVALKHLTHEPYSLIPVRRTRRFRSLISVRFIKTHIRLIRTHGCKKL